MSIDRRTNENDIDFAKQFGKLDLDDTEFAHSQADDILLSALRAAEMHRTADAWERACIRSGFWYA